MGGSSFNSTRGDHLSEAAEDLNLIPVNDSVPTIFNRENKVSNNLDLIFMSVELTNLTTCTVTGDSSYSDHFLVTAFCYSSPKFIKLGSTDDWSVFSEN